MDWSKLLSKRVDVWVSVIFVVISAVLMLILLGHPKSPFLRNAVAAIWVIWTIVPPAFFLCEWTAFDDTRGKAEFEKLKYSHDLASKFWIAGVSVVTAALIYAHGGLGKLFGG